MKRLLKITIAAILCIVLCSSAASACLVLYPVGSIRSVGSAVEIVDETEDSVTIRKTNDEPFKILMFTDMHLAWLDKKHPLKAHAQTLEKMVENIQNEQPDLVLLGGDNVTSGFNRMRSHQLARAFEKLGVYWGGVLGNHEGDNATSIRRDTMVRIFSSYKHCLMRQGKTDVDGNCNYSIRILNADGSLKQAVICLDSFDEMSDEMKKEHGFDPSESVYDVIKPSQIDWYTAQVDSMKKEYGKCPSFALFHIPLTQYADAAAAVEKGEAKFLWGDKRENICCAGFDSGLFDAIKASGCTTTVFCGHDHKNNFGVKWQGITLSYIEPSGYGAYGLQREGAPESEWLQGYTRLMLSDNGTFTHEQIRNSAK
ncbi:MAG: metallophosphoesterase [Clostridia bacterium]|nr:metallophosphoesterase [Clostridia bacterium]